MSFPAASSPRLRAAPSDRRRAVATLTALLLALALLPASSAPAAASSDRGSLQTFSEARLLAGHQAARRDPAQGGVVGELVWSSDLADIARASSDRMAALGRLQHDPAVGKALCCGSRFGDNVGTARSSAAISATTVRRNIDRVMSAWLQSGGHWDLLLADDFTHVGIGVHVASDGTVWATAVFQARDRAVLQSRPSPTSRGVDLACDGTSPRTFRDVGTTHRDTVGCLADQGIVKGIGGELFDPASSVTRGQLAMILDRTIRTAGRDLPAPLRGAFPDVRSSSTAGPAIERLAAAGIVGGRGDGRFLPERPITRTQLAAQLEAAAIYLDGDPSATGRGYFRDVPDHGRSARAIDASAHQGLMIGDRSGRFLPDAPLRRDQTATVMARYLDLLLSGG